MDTEFDRYRRSQPTELTLAERAEVFALAADLPAAIITPADRQRVVRCLIERVTVTVDKNSETVQILIQWSGGCQTSHLVRRPVGRYDQLSNLSELLSRIDTLRGEGLALAAVAERLSREGYRPPKRTGVFTQPMLVRLLASRRVRSANQLPPPSDDLLTTDEWWLSDLVRRLEVPVATARGWVRRHWVHARTVPTPSGLRWAVWADADELSRLSELRSCPRSWDCKPQRLTLIVPKPRPDAVF